MAEIMLYSKIKNRTWEILSTAAHGDYPAVFFQWFMLVLILLNVIAVVFATVQSVNQQFNQFFNWFETFSVIIFSLEYLLRLWSCTSAPDRRPLWGRIKFAFYPMSIIDLLSVLPFYLPFFGLDLRFLRILRMFRVFRLAKIGRYYQSLNLMRNVFASKKEEIVLSATIMGVLLVLSSSLLYYLENEAQPQAFSSIPAAMWWAVTALTTVGYGDIYPITPLGKFVASLIAISGIGMFALPTGIISSGFVEEIQKHKKEHAETPENITCPHCGKKFNHGETKQPEKKE
jgi:voltage-gated potassium channel